MSQTNFNKYVRITFDREVKSQNLAANLLAFKLVITQRDHYQGILYTKELIPISISYATSSTSDLIIKFADSSSFRKAEGNVTLQYNAVYGNLYGALPKDRLQSFNKIFSPVSLDMYQNPYEEEVVSVKLLNTAVATPIKITTKQFSTSSETLCVALLYTADTVIHQVGAINP